MSSFKEKVQELDTKIQTIKIKLRFSSYDNDLRLTLVKTCLERLEVWATVSDMEVIDAYQPRKVLAITMALKNGVAPTPCSQIPNHDLARAQAKRAEAKMIYGTLETGEQKVHEAVEAYPKWFPLNQ